MKIVTVLIGFVLVSAGTFIVTSTAPWIEGLAMMAFGIWLIYDDDSGHK